MAQLVIAAAGAALGGALVPGVIALGVTGAQAGWIVGNLIGSSFAPAQKSQGPRLSDLSVGSSAYGTPIPYTQGNPRIAGQIVWASTKREIATTTRSGGKGGPKQKVTTYAYEVDLLILLTDNIIEGVGRIWSNGKLIWNKSPSADAPTVAASDTTAAWTAIRIYTGLPTQQPDPTYQAAVTIANAPAYRGRGSVFIQGLQLGQSGQIPNLTFEINGMQSGDHTPGDGLTALQSSFASSSGADVSGNGVPVTQNGGTLGPGYYEVNFTPGTATNLGISWGGAGPNCARTAVGQAYTVEFLYQLTRHVDANNIGSQKIINIDNLTSSMTGGSAPIGHARNGTGVPATQTYSSSYYGSPANQSFPLNTMQHLAFTWGTDNQFRAFLNGVLLAGPASDPSNWIGGSTQIGFISPSLPGFWTDFTLRCFGVRVRRAKMYADGGFTPPATAAAWGSP